MICVQTTTADAPDVPIAIDDQMDTCMDVARFMNVISNDVYEEERPLRLKSVGNGKLY